MEEESLIEKILGYQNDYAIFTATVNFRREGNEYKVEILDPPGCAFGYVYNETEIKSSIEYMESEDWKDVFQDSVEGVYFLKILFRKCVDSDDYRTWEYYEHSECSIDFYYGKLEEYMQEREREDIFFDLPF